MGNYAIICRDQKIQQEISDTVENEINGKPLIYENIGEVLKSNKKFRGVIIYQTRLDNTDEIISLKNFLAEADKDTEVIYIRNRERNGGEIEKCMYLSKNKVHVGYRILSVSFFLSYVIEESKKNKKKFESILEKNLS